MNKQGAQEIKMPALISSEYYEKSGRLDSFGKSIYKLKAENLKTRKVCYAYIGNDGVHRVQAPQLYDNEKQTKAPREA